MPKYSVIIPVYNRPDEVDELLESLTAQSFKDFEVVIIEDGSSQKCKTVCDKYGDSLTINYYFKENTGQGFSRNYGGERAKGEYFVFFDSDVLVPSDYFQTVNNYLLKHDLAAYGGEDRASADFSALQKAISYAMTAFFTTGGIRSSNKNIGGNYQLRSYNMGIRQDIFKKVEGFKKRDMGEDMELNQRLDLLKVEKHLIPDAFVFHKRRGTFKDFFKQVFSFGRTRVQLKRDYAIRIKPVHLLPVFYALFILSIPVTYFIAPHLFNCSALALISYFAILFIDSLQKNKSIWVALLSIPASFIQLFAYGLGFLKEVVWVKV